MNDERVPQKPMSVSEAFGMDDEWGFSDADEGFANGLPSSADNIEQFTPAMDEPQHGAPIIKEIDFGDGYPVKIEATDVDDLALKIIEAQNQKVAQMLMTQPAGEQRQMARPNKYEHKPLTNDQLGALMMNFPKDPIGATGKLLEENLGMPIDSIKEKLQMAETIITNDYEKAIGQQFVMRHTKFDKYGQVVSGDYNPCPENADRILRLLQAEGKERSPETFEYAFNKLNAVNGLIPLSLDEEEFEDNPAPTAISGRDSYYQEGTSGSDDDEFLRQAIAGKYTTKQIEDYYARRKSQSRR